jgi:hypothetical protein
MVTYRVAHRVGTQIVGIGTAPSPPGECGPPPLWFRGEAHSLGGEGVGESQFRRVDVHCGTLYKCTLWNSIGGNGWHSASADSFNTSLHDSKRLPKTFVYRNAECPSSVKHDRINLCHRF